MQFSAGNVLSRTFGVTFSKFGQLLAIALVLYVPAYILNGLLTAMGGTEEVTIPGGRTMVVQQNPGFGWLGSFVVTVAGWLVAAAFAHAVFQTLRNREVSISDSLGAGFRRFWAVIGVSLLVQLIVSVGFLLLIVPGLIFYCMYFVSVPVLVVEGRGVTAAMARSSDLTRGNRRGIFGLVLLLGLLGIAVSLFLIPMILVGGIGAMVAGAVVAIFFGMLGGVAQVVAYHDLRVAKEGITTEEIAAVFD